jgi:hypothetical protein
MWCYNYSKLENSHNYIQWLFPLGERSEYYYDAPCITTQFIKKYAADGSIQDNMRKSLNLMLGFYGFVLSGPSIQLSDDFGARSAGWITEQNHNYLRITRILKSLKIFGLESEALGLFNILDRVYKEYNSTGFISAETYGYWVRAVEE